ncbi:MAG: glutamine-hydrolyzing GMP synthase, partial [Candidatus Hydrogenedentes bacterium]|nr:glutamine-hydrolyzing GMP synthase [Candidatus Hydrogenedentota bacterium]
MNPESNPIIVLDFGAQYSKLIARRIREASVLSLILPHTSTVEELRAYSPAGIILSGGPASVLVEGAPMLDKAILNGGLDVPILGICYGAQLLAHLQGGVVEPAEKHEYGIAHLAHSDTTGFLRNVSENTQVWMSHGDKITCLPEGYARLGETENCDNAVIANPDAKQYAVQFHPEVVHTVEGKRILNNFAHNICGCNGEWQMENYVATAIEAIREK